MVARQWCLAFVLLIGSQATYANIPSKMAFTHVLDDGSSKPLGGVNAIVQDRQGFMWFAGNSGLGRFDGHQLRLFPADVDDPYALSSNYIHDLLVDHDGVLWVATDAGLCRYRVRSDQFDCRALGGEAGLPLTHTSVTAFALAADNTLYIGSVAGFYELSADRQHLRPIAPSAELVDGVNGPSVIDIALDQNGLVWIATTEFGLMQFEPGASAALGQTSALRHEVGDKIKAVHVDQVDRLWVGTYGAGVVMLDASRTEFTHYRADGMSGLTSNVVWDISGDSRGNIWFAVDQGGLVRFDDKGQRFYGQHANPADPSSLQSDQVRTVFEDRNGDLWLGLFPFGVNFFNHTTSEIFNFRHDPVDPNSLSHSSVLSIHQSEQGDIWLGTENGLDLFQPHTGQFQRVASNGTGLPAKAVLSIAQFDPNTLWLGTWSGGLAQLDIPSGVVSPIDTRPAALPDAVNSLFIWDILRDKQGDMWLATEFNGANHYDVESKKFTYYRALSDDSSSLSSDFVWSIAQTRSGDLLFATQGGLDRWRKGAKSFDGIAVESAVSRGKRSKSILAVFQDKRGKLWVGTQDRGIFVFTAAGKFVRHLGLTEGLPSLTVAGFIEDNAGDIWAGTINGLVRISPRRWQVTVLNSGNGLVGNNFNRNAFLKDSSGRLFFGGADGLSVFHPAKLKQEQLEFDVLVTDIRIHNQSVTIGAPGAPIRHAPALHPKVELSHRDSMVSFEFSALNFRKASAMVYAYRLDGFDVQWHDIGKSYSATYTNLPPGDYQFRVRASSGTNQWRESLPLNVTMRAAPWLSQWAFLTYGLALVCLGALIASYFNLRLKTSLYRTLSTQDQLTGLFNRMGVMQQARSLFESNGSRPSCLIFIDVDYFKRINDERGHDAGDRILVDVASVIIESVRRADIVGRWGGEEFIVLCPGVQRDAISGIAEKIRLAVVSHVFEQSLNPLKVSISLGVAYVLPGEAFDSAFKRADLALYQGKVQQRNCIVIADDL